jgi:predicted Zn-dependent peptidase
VEIILTDHYGIIHTKGYHSTIINAGFLAGSRFDPNNQRGLALLTEHLFVCSLENSPTESDKTFRMISEINGQTNREALQGWIRTSPAYTREALDRMLRVIFLNELDDTLFESEKKSVISAALQNDHNKDPYDLVFSKTYEVVFGSHPLSNPETGTYSTTQNLTIEDCHQHFLDHYRKGKKYFIIACDMDQTKVLSHLKEWENFFPDQTKNISPPSEQTIPLAIIPKVLNLSMQAGTVEVSLAIPVPKTPGFATWMMDFISYILGKSPNSVLFKLLRIELALAYDPRTLCFHYTDCSLFIVYLGINEDKNTEKTISLVEDIFTHISSYLSEEQLELYKLAFKEQYWMNSDHIFNFSRTLLFQALSDTPMHPDLYLKYISSITIKDIDSFLTTYLNPATFSRIIIR